MKKRDRTKFFWGSLTIGAAILLRFLWLGDFEYKADQIYTFEATQQQAWTERYPGLGMPSSVGLRNPGASVWVFSALADLTRVQTPWGLSAVVALWAVLGILGFAFLIRRYLPAQQRVFWGWGLAAFSVAPQVVRYQRVIWAQSVLLPFGAACLFFVFKRKKFWGALGLGFFGLLLGQIHMPGFIFFGVGAAALFWTDRRNVDWRGFAVGVLLSTLLMLPWFDHVLNFTAPAGLGGSYAANVLSFKFWLLWFSEAFTDGFRSLLGSRDAWRFFGETAWLQVPLAVLGLAALGQTFRDCARGQGRDYRALAFAFGGYGVVLTLLGTSVYRHYLEVAYPLPYVTAALAISHFPVRVKRFAYPLWVTMLALLSFQLLWFLHRNGGAPAGDYGATAATTKPKLNPK